MQCSYDSDGFILFKILWIIDNDLEQPIIGTKKVYRV